jgi:hypothetical protein
LPNQFFRSSLLLVYTVNTSIVIFSSYLIAQPLSSFFSFVDLHCKALPSLFPHHIWLRKHFYRSSLLLTLFVKHFYRYFLTLNFIVKRFYRYFLIKFDWWINSIILPFCWFTP